MGALLTFHQKEGVRDTVQHSTPSRIQTDQKLRGVLLPAGGRPGRVRGSDAKAGPHPC